MLAFLLLLTATALGLCSVAGLRVALGPLTRVGLGMTVGQQLLLWVPLLFAAAFDWGARAAGLGAIALFVGALALSAAALRGDQGVRRLPRQVLEGLRNPRNRPQLAVGALFLLLFSWLHHTHYLLPRDNGLYSAGVTWGDLPVHLGLATRFLHAEGFGPLEHPLCAGMPLAYPFLPDHSAAVLTALGLPLRWAFIVGGVLPLSSFLLLIHGVCRLWMGGQGRALSAIALVLFLLAGGLGFWQVGARLFESAAPLKLLASVNATYISPHIMKSGHIGNLFVAARTASYGMPIGLAAILLAGHVLEAKAPERRPLLLAGVLAGSLPLIHSHSFLVACGAVAYYALLGRRWGRRWGLCLMPLLATSLPQVGWLLAASDRGFVRFAPGFLRRAPDTTAWLTDLTLGMGLSLLLVPIAFAVAEGRARRLAFPFLLLLPLANVMTFTPAEYDNVKLLAWFDLATAPLVAGLLAKLAHVGGQGARRWGLVAAGLLLLGATASGALAVGFELTNRARVASYEGLRLAELVAQHTRPSDVIATAASHQDPVAMFSGRRPLIATPYILRTHGITIKQRARELVTLYAGGDAARAVIARHGVAAVVVGPRERRDLRVINERFLAESARDVFETDGRRVYVLRR